MELFTTEDSAGTNFTKLETAEIFTMGSSEKILLHCPVYKKTVERQ
jgi:hypothetical protein